MRRTKHQGGAAPQHTSCSWTCSGLELTWDSCHKDGDAGACRWGEMHWESWDAFTVTLISLSARQWYIPPITARCACSLCGRRTCSLWLVNTSSVAAVGSSTVRCLSRMVSELVSSRWCWAQICLVGRSGWIGLKHLSNEKMEHGMSINLN